MHVCIWFKRLEGCSVLFDKGKLARGQGLLYRGGRGEMVIPKCDGNVLCVVCRLLTSVEVSNGTCYRPCFGTVR